MNTCLRERERDGERERDERGMSVEDEGKTDGWRERESVSCRPGRGRDRLHWAEADQRLIWRFRACKNTSTHAHTHTHISSFHLLCSACKGPAVTNQVSNDACMGWSGGGGVMEVERSMERLRKPSPTSSTVKRDQSAACRVCLSLYVLLWGDAWGAVNERNDVWKSCSGRIQWKWLCSRWHRNVLWVDYEPTPSLHLSVAHIRVHFSNGLFTKWALAEFI